MNKELILKIKKVLKAKGLGGILQAIVLRAWPVKPRMLSLCQELVKERHGLEIGGPTAIFSRKGNLAIYPHIARLDNCNFGQNTTWERSLQEGHTFKYDQGRPAGFQHISEAVDLKKIPDGTYDFVLSCHSIEHIANPLAAIREWMRVLLPEGRLLLVTPHMEGTFDHHRPLTNLCHLIEDLQGKTGEDDLTHLAEILKFHDFDRDLGSPDFAAFKVRSERNLEFRCLHHHVFDTSLVVNMIDYLGMQILKVEAIRQFHIIVAAQKLPEGTTPINQPFLASSAKWRHRSPFKMDRNC
jgi:SAM-dependent methyltransferase